MKNRIVKTSIIIFLLSTFLFAQEDDTLNNNCPPLFTREKTINPEINILNFEVIDSTNFDSLPKFRGNLVTISKKIIYPEIAKRAGVEGTVKVLLTIDSVKNVIKGNILKGLGAGIDESALSVLYKEKFWPARKENNKVSSQIVVDIKFDLNIQIDKPEMELDEIKYESHGGQLYLIRSIIFKKDGSAYFSEDHGTEPPKTYVSKVNPYLFTKLNDFIFAQCFIDFENEYVDGSILHAGKTIITIKSTELEKSVTSKGQLEPVGLWAIRTVILQVKDSLKWEEVTE